MPTLEHPAAFVKFPAWEGLGGPGPSSERSESDQARTPAVVLVGEGDNGFRVVDVWESEEAFGRFGETLIPILQEVGVEGRPEIYPAHTYVSG